MTYIRLIDTYSMVKDEEISAYKKKVEKIHEEMEAGTSVGSEFLGWLHYPSSQTEKELREIAKYGETLNRENEKIICLGIGGSFLGALASIKALSEYSEKVVFYGNSFSALELEKGLKSYNPKKDHLIVISKSGTTMETSIAFRLFRKKAYEQLGEDSFLRMTAITDGKKGSLLSFAREKGIKRFVIPGDIGGRYSVLSPVGLLPMAACGIDIVSIMDGAKKMEENLMETDLKKNHAYRYAVLRRILYDKGKKIEIFASYEPKLFQISDWFKQLFGESEGKQEKGILPINLLYSTDLHSMGQFVQEGPKNLFETILSVEKSLSDLTLPNMDSIDGLEGYEGMKIDYMNSMARQGTIKAHVEGGVPNIIIEMLDLSEFSLGGLFYFLQKACAMSAYLQGVNPFNQPGVEAYKREIKKKLK